MPSSLSINIDISKWVSEFGKNVKTTEEAQEKTIKTAAPLLKAEMENLTPLGDPSLWKWPAKPDYNPGTLKKSWTLTYNGKEATIRNDAPYAYRVEFGWSTQAPEGMMRRAILNFPAILNKAASENKK